MREPVTPSDPDVVTPPCCQSGASVGPITNQAPATSARAAPIRAMAMRPDNIRSPPTIPTTPGTSMSVQWLCAQTHAFVVDPVSKSNDGPT